ncbi:MAG: tRNA (N(6)-L-threonylcarbamoyladenosine(37)-C(2))-methylthiotransferase MtaB [Bacteroidetes bacterium]|jgi:threonylcarbamoyladenosine tRNA methylthiotransferase MtaB|nr:tRNA (N(6)-L-threonylcarbamoyladenosine(37)-C(2))-methylthiotransferase MtaB [Bacteroidota bacterium]
MNQPSVAFHTLGCKLNFSETSAIGRQLKEAGFAKREFKDGADVYVINTCSVTDNADKECRKIVRDALHVNPEAFIVVIGCYAQLKPDEIGAIEGVDLVLGAKEKFNLPNYLDVITKRDTALVNSCEVDDVNFFVDAYSAGDRTRAFLKVQDGCDYSCTFCTIPLARGKSRSDSIFNVMNNARKLAREGIKEIVLTGVNLGDFGKGNAGGKQHGANFRQLIEELDQVEGIERFRISSIEPNLLKDESIEFVAKSKRFVPHFHIPLQSGSNTILKKMKRRYLRELYASRVESIKRHMPHACIGVDVIVGFPGETEQEFMETFNFLQQLDISYLHVFTYSERANTEALNMKGVVPVNERRRRNKMLRNLSDKKLRAFYEQHVGSVREVLFEHENKNGMMSGYTDNYIKVILPYQPELCNTIVPVYLDSFSAEGHIIGEPTKQRATAI